jgi:hypothetical protein
MWSKKFDKCSFCGRNDRPFKAKGKCIVCYKNEHPQSKDSRRRYRDRTLFGGLREFHLSANRNCVLCNVDQDLVVHHIDCDKNNNVLDNFATLCRACHSRVHKLIKYLKLAKDRPELFIKFL